MAGLLGGQQDLQGRAPRGQGEEVHPGHVPIPLGRRPARGPPRGLHRHGHHGPVLPHEGPGRAAPHGLGQLRAARRAARHQHRHAPPGDHRREHRQLQAPAQEPGLRLRLGPGGGHHRPRLRQVDPVDLPPALQEGLGHAERGAGELVPGAGHGAGQRGGDRRALGARVAPGQAAAAAPVGVQDHRVRRPAGGRAGGGGPAVARGHPGRAEGLDRPLRRGADRLPGGGRGGRLLRVHHAAGHLAGRDLRGAGPRAPAGGKDHRRGPEGGRAGLRGGRGGQERHGPDGGGRQGREDGRGHGRRGRAPAHGGGGAHLGGRLRAGVLRDGRGYGRARARRAGLRLRPGLRPPRPTGGGPGGGRGRGRGGRGRGGLHGPRRGRELGRVRRARHRGLQGRRDRPAGGAGRRGRAGDLQAARLGVQPAAVLGRAHPRLLPRGAGGPRGRPPRRRRAHHRLRHPHPRARGPAAADAAGDGRLPAGGRPRGLPGARQGLAVLPGPRGQLVRARDEHHATVGRQLLVLLPVHRQPERGARVE
mmetsp:Transcript_20064/g.31616  ORF Transcript_20064/g.31616 Transcript_20064/m.31616 type:complete len:533 (+) Transcript_20064:651-2249(+)